MRNKPKSLKDILDKESLESMNKMEFVIATIGSAMKSFQDPEVAISYIINVFTGRLEPDDFLPIFYVITDIINHAKENNDFIFLLKMFSDAPIAESSGLIHDVKDYVKHSTEKLNNPKVRLSFEEEITMAVSMFFASLHKALSNTDIEKRLHAKAFKRA